MRNKIGSNWSAPVKGTSVKNPATGINPDRLGVIGCPAAKAELEAKRAVLKELRQRAKSAGKRIRGGTENIVGPQRGDIRWLFPTLQEMARDFASRIDEGLNILNQPGVDREALVGQIYVNILCIRATHTIFFGDTFAEGLA